VKAVIITHKISETFESPRESCLRVDLNEDIAVGVEIHLQETRSVEGAVEQH